MGVSIGKPRLRSFFPILLVLCLISSAPDLAFGRTLTSYYTSYKRNPLTGRPEYGEQQSIYFQDTDETWKSGGCTRQVQPLGEDGILMYLGYDGAEHDVNPAWPNYLDAVEIHHGNFCKDKKPLKVLIDGRDDAPSGISSLFHNTPSQSAQNSNMEGRFGDKGIFSQIDEKEPGFKPFIPERHDFDDAFIKEGMPTGSLINQYLQGVDTSRHSEDDFNEMMRLTQPGDNSVFNFNSNNDKPGRESSDNMNALTETFWRTMNEGSLNNPTSRLEMNQEPVPHVTEMNSEQSPGSPDSPGTQQSPGAEYNEPQEPSPALAHSLQVQPVLPSGMQLQPLDQGELYEPPIAGQPNVETLPQTQNQPQAIPPANVMESVGGTIVVPGQTPSETTTESDPSEADPVDEGFVVKMPQAGPLVLHTDYFKYSGPTSIRFINSKTKKWSKEHWKGYGKEEEVKKKSIPKTPRIPKPSFKDWQLNEPWDRENYRDAYEASSTPVDYFTFRNTDMNTSPNRITHDSLGQGTTNAFGQGLHIPFGLGSNRPSEQGGDRQTLQVNGLPASTDNQLYSNFYNPFGMRRSEDKDG